MFVCMMLAPSVMGPHEEERELPYWHTEGNDAGKKDVLGTLNDRDLRIITNGEQRMVITSEGNVGIGIADPLYKLDVDGDARFSGTLHIGDDGDPSLIVAPSGNVGIGIEDPQYELDVEGDIQVSKKVLASAYASNSPLIFEAPAGTERARIDDVTGYFGIGTTTPSGELEVVGDIVVSGKVDGVDIGVEVDSLHAADAVLQDQIDSYSTKQLIQDFVVASGKSVTAGDVVSFLDGYVQKRFKSEYVFNSAATSYISGAVLSSTKFVVAYRDNGNSGYGTAVIGDVSGNTITYGSGYVFNPAYTLYISAAALSSNKFVVAYSDQGDYKYYGTAVIGDVSGDTITFGSEYVFNPYETKYISAAALSSNKFVVAYSDQEDYKYYGTAVIGDVSGDTITYGSEYVFNSAATHYISGAALSSTKFVVVYVDGGNSNFCTAIIGDVLDNAITYGLEYVFNTPITFYISAAALSSNKFMVAYRDDGNSYYGTATIGDVSDMTITFGSKYVFNSGYTQTISATTLSSTKFVMAYYDGDNSGYGTAVIGDVSGDTITYGSEYVFNSATTFYISAAALSSTKFVVAYCDVGDSDYGTAVISDITSDGKNIYSQFVIGIAKETKTAGQTVPVIISGVSDVHLGLTPGLIYYSYESGDLTAEQTNCRIGLAISSTEILLAGPFF